jgi:hypothetical protein
MKFKIVENDMDKLLTFRILSENNMVEIGVYRTLFGWRVRAGFANEGVCYLDWCAGSNWKDVERLYSLCYAILSKRSEDKCCFDGLPGSSTIKPFYLDLDFLEKISKEAGYFELLSLSQIE